jgi:hypothetical protein
MADPQQTQEPTKSAEQAGENTQANGRAKRKTAVRAAVVAAASGATALVAKKAFSGGGKDSDSRRQRQSDDKDVASRVSGLVESGWDAAKESLLPVAEDAASAVGEYVARSAPDIVRERIVPRFISGFERVHSRATDDGD